jgi:hypothetical protein
LSPADRDRLRQALDPIADSFLRARAEGVHFVLAFAPVKYRAYAPYCEFDPRGDPAGWSLNNLPAWIGDQAAQREFPSWT